jgi:SAM-dependent methyltransferase
MTPLEQHQIEIERNLALWRRKPLLRKIYAGFYEKILAHIDTSIPGAVVEIGSGIGNLKARLPQALCTDLFPNPWLDLVCDGYELPFQNGSVSHLILFDVFHHLRRPRAFLNEARRALTKEGRVILFEPFISAASLPVYGLLHHEPVAMKSEIDFADDYPRPRDYYAAQGNASRLFFGHGERWPRGTRLVERLVSGTRRSVQRVQLPSQRRLQQTRPVSCCPVADDAEHR